MTSERASKDELKQRLTDEQYRVTQEKGTERPFTGHLPYNKEEGVYRCIVRGTALFSSEQQGEGEDRPHRIVDKERRIR